MRVETARQRETTCTVQQTFFMTLDPSMCVISVSHAEKMCVRQQRVCLHGQYGELWHAQPYRIKASTAPGREMALDPGSRAS